MSDQQLPIALQEALARDSSPVSPLPPAWLRCIWAMGVAAAVLLMSVTVFGYRSDMGEIPMWLSWGCSIMGLGLAAMLMALALRESIPGRAVPWRITGVAVTIAVAFQVGVGLLTYHFSQGLNYADEPMAHGMGCAKQDMASALPTLIMIALLIVRAMPVRAPSAGFLAGAGAAIAADAVTHLRCPVSDMRHVLVWHTGAVAAIALGGWVAGWLWQRLRGLPRR